MFDYSVRLFYHSSMDFDTWLQQETGGNYSKTKELYDAVVEQGDQPVVADTLDHILKSGAYPHSEALDTIDFSSLAFDIANNT